MAYRSLYNKYGHRCVAVLFGIGSYPSYGIVQLRTQSNGGGVQLPFLAMDSELVLDCLLEGSTSTAKSLLGDQLYYLTAAIEINGVTIKYDYDICTYFSEPESDGAYLIAAEYVKLVANTRDGQNQVAVPTKYIEFLDDSSENRLEEFVAEIDPNGLVYVDFGDDDHSNDRIQLSSSTSLTTTETYIILALYTGNVKYNCFAAEVEYHADQAIYYYDFVGSVYNSAIRADMTTEDNFFGNFFGGYHDLESDIVEEQELCHGEM